MAALIHFYKADNTNRATASTTEVELTDYTITWGDLTAAGFANGDDVFILVSSKIRNSADANQNNFFAVGFGTTFAGRVEEADSVQRNEAFATSMGDQYIWFDRRTLVTNENIYFRANATGGTAAFHTFRCFIIKLGGLASNDFAYAEATHSGDAALTYNTAGAGVSIPQTGDWWILACSRWLIDDGNNDFVMAIHDGTSDISEVKDQGADAADERVVGTMAYKASLASGTTVRTRYRNSAVLVQDCVATKIFALRLNAFQDHAGAQTTNTITHSVLDTQQEYAGFPTYSLGTTGPFIVVGWPIHILTETAKRPYGRIQIDEADWPAVDNDRHAISSNDITAKIAPLHMGYNASQAAGTLDIDLDCAEDLDISPTYTCAAQTAVAFSLTLSGTVAPVSLAGPRMSRATMALFS